MSIKTFTTGEVLTASDTNTFLANSGLVYVAGSTFTTISSASPLDVQSCFNSTYTNYRVIIQWVQNTSNAAMYFRMLSGTNTPETGGYYNFGIGGSYYLSPTYYWAGFAQSTPASPDTSFFCGSVGSAYRGQTWLEIGAPNVASQDTITTMQFFSQYTGTYSNAALAGTGSVSTATQYTGIRFYPNAGTATGRVSVYGYRIA